MFKIVQNVFALGVPSHFGTLQNARSEPLSRLLTGIWFLLLICSFLLSWSTSFGILALSLRAVSLQCPCFVAGNSIVGRKKITRSRSSLICYFRSSITDLFDWLGIRISQRRCARRFLHLQKVSTISDPLCHPVEWMVIHSTRSVLERSRDTIYDQFGWFTVVHSEGHLPSIRNRFPMTSIVRKTRK